MNIRIDPEQGNTRGPFACPSCRWRSFRRHGCYVRKGFHAPNHAVALTVKVPRYRCLNPDCGRCTFSVLPRYVLPYCRFYWFYLLSVRDCLSRGSTVYHLARHVWHVSWAVLVRALALLRGMGTWVEQLHRELTDGAPAQEPERMVKSITARIGRHELVQRWYRHRYPSRFE